MYLFTVLVFFFEGYTDHRDLHSFPTRRSSDLAKALTRHSQPDLRWKDWADWAWSRCRSWDSPAWYRNRQREDRKSTRLNSSHVEISYAVFCLKKKKKLRTP